MLQSAGDCSGCIYDEGLVSSAISVLSVDEPGIGPSEGLGGVEV